MLHSDIQHEAHDIMTLLQWTFICQWKESQVVASVPIQIDFRTYVFPTNNMQADEMEWKGVKWIAIMEMSSPANNCLRFSFLFSQWVQTHKVWNFAFLLSCERCIHTSYDFDYCFDTIQNTAFMSLWKIWIWTERNDRNQTCFVWYNSFRAAMLPFFATQNLCFVLIDFSYS